MEDTSADSGEGRESPTDLSNTQNINNKREPLKIDECSDNGFKLPEKPLSNDISVFKLPAMPVDMEGPSTTSNSSRKSPKSCGYHLHDHITMCNVANQVNRRIRIRLTSRQRNYLINAMVKDPTLSAIHTDPADQESYDRKWNLLATELNKFGPPKPISQWQCVSRDIRAKNMEHRPVPHTSRRPPPPPQPPMPVPIRVEPNPPIVNNNAPIMNNNPPNLNNMPPQMHHHQHALSPSPPPSPPEIMQPCLSHLRLESLFEEAREAFLQVSAQQNNVLERLLTFLDTTESRRRVLEEKRMQYEERRLRVEERIVNVLERLVTSKKV